MMLDARCPISDTRYPIPDTDTRYPIPDTRKYERPGSLGTRPLRMGRRAGLQACLEVILQHELHNAVAALEVDLAEVRDRLRRIAEALGHVARVGRVRAVAGRHVRDRDVADGVERQVDVV